MFDLKRNTKIFKDASDMYTDFKAVTTKEDLIKINLFDYLNKFGDYTDDGASTADKKNILKQLMILTGVWDDSSQASLDKLTSHNQFNLFNIFALWNGGTSEGVIDANGVVNNNLKHTILRGFGHLNEIILDNFTDVFVDLEEKFLFGYTNNKFYKTSLIRKYHILNEHQALKEDFEFNIKVFKKALNFYLLNEPLYFYMKRNNGSLTSRFVPDYFRIHMQTLSSFKSLIKEK